MQIRRFSSDVKTPIPTPNVGMAGVPVLFGREQVASLSEESLATRFKGLPFLVENSDASVVALYFAPHARMQEHSNPRVTLCLVTRGSGWLRIGGPAGETRQVQAGDAVLWPPDVDHMVWTEDEELDVIVIELPRPHPPTPSPSARMERGRQAIKPDQRVPRDHGTMFDHPSPPQWGGLGVGLPIDGGALQGEDLM